MNFTPTDLHIGADDISSDGHKLGELHRLVLKRSDFRLTHIVVDIGWIRAGHKIWEGGLGLEYDRVAPVTVVTSANDDRIELALTADSFKELPEYTAEAFEEPQDLTPGDDDIADIASASSLASAAFNSAPGGWIVERLNKPLDSVDIAEGTPVWRQEPHEKLGEVHRLILDDQTGRLTAFVIKRGFLLTRDVVLPVRYVSELLDDIVHVDMSDEELDRLREYQE
jgi:uncharacterized protein YrrD